MIGVEILASSEVADNDLYRYLWADLARTVREAKEFEDAANG